MDTNATQNNFFFFIFAHITGDGLTRSTPEPRKAESEVAPRQQRRVCPDKGK